MTTPYIKLQSPIDDTALVCRGCLARSGEMKNMIEWGLHHDFNMHTNIPILRSECLSQLLCTSCEETLMICKSFQSQCQQSDIKLKDTAKKKSQYYYESDDLINSTSSKLYNDKLVIKITAPETESKVFLTCPHNCKAKFMKKIYLQIHMTKKHKIDKNFPIDLQYYCSYHNCPYHVQAGKKKWFTGRKFLNQHYKKVHRNKIFHCDECGSSFPANSDYVRHLRTCNMSFSCEDCNVKYDSHEKLLVHMLRKHPDLHKQYKTERKAEKRKLKIETECKKLKTETIDYTFCDSPKRSFATQTLSPEENIKNDVSLVSWQSTPGKTDEISTQTVFEDLLSLKSQTSEDDSSMFFSETVSLSDIQTQTFPLEFGLSRCNKETITSETQSPDLSIKETQTCFCLYDSPKTNLKLFDSITSSPNSTNLTSTETQTPDSKANVKSDVLLGFSTTETQTCFDK